MTFEFMQQLFLRNKLIKSAFTVTAWKKLSVAYFSEKKCVVHGRKLDKNQ